MNLTCPLLPTTLIRVKLTQAGRASINPISASGYDRPVPIADFMREFGGKPFQAEYFISLHLVLPDSTEFKEDKPAMTLGALLFAR